MEIEIQKCLYDAHKASETIQNFLKSKKFEDYISDLMLRSAVERQFEILGEASRRVRDRNEELLEQSIRGWRGTISFRNILAHVVMIVSTMKLPLELLRTIFLL